MLVAGNDSFNEVKVATKTLDASNTKANKNNNFFISLHSILPYAIAWVAFPPKKLLDVSKIKSLGWRPKINLPDGIKKSYEYYIGRLNN